MMSRTEASLPGPRPARRRVAALASAATALGAAAVLLPSTTGAVSLPERTLRVSTNLLLQDAAGASQNPVLSVDGRTIAFETTAPDVGPDDANGTVSDIVAADLVTGVRRLVSEAEGGADGPSLTPTISGDGRYVAFVSYATNLVAGDTNGQPDIFVRDGRGAIARVTVAPDGSPANGPSHQPDVSNNGRYVVFTSEATNLVAGDTNGKPDVFIRDLAQGRTELVSRTAGGAGGNARSSQPAVSGDGQFVAFESAASDLVAKDTNGIADVFVRDRLSGRTERVSVSSDKARQQDKAVTPPFTMAPDISRDGNLVVFESDATNLVAADGNRRTDVFLRDRKAKTTRIVSASSVNVQGDNDSFNPRLSAGGRYLAFQSFATNLVPKGDDGPREDVFVRDLKTGTTTVASVTSTGAARAASPQFLQRPSLSNDARVVAFGSAVTNLVAGDANAAADVFVRRLDAPATRLVRRPTKKRRSLTVAADDPRATRFICRIEGRAAYECGSTVRPDGRGGRLSVRAGGPGLLFDPKGVELRVAGDRKRPSVRISAVRGRSLRTLRGRASDSGGSGLSHVEVGLVYFARDARCRVLVGKRFVRRACTARREYVRATGGRTWRLRLPRAVRGPVVIYARAVDRAGNRSRTVRRVAVLG